MMKRFGELKYERPDFAAEKKELKQYISEIENAKGPEELIKIFLERDQRSRHFSTMYNLAYIRNTIDTKDAFYEGEMTNFYKEQGELTLLGQKADAAVLKSPYLGALEKEFGPLLIRRMETEQKLASEDVVGDIESESLLCQEYSRLVSSCVTEFEGEVCNFSTLSKYMQDVDREKRKKAFEAWASMYEGISKNLDDIYDRMIKVRRDIAQKLGFDSYISYIYASFGRFDYGPEDVKNFRRLVKEEVVPICQKLFEEQASRLGLTEMSMYDEQLTEVKGNAVPAGGKEKMLELSLIHI